jgi:multicomponent Na+:H+ antiporter subunit E
MNNFAMHLLVAFVWTFLIGNRSLGGFCGGLIAGFLLLWMFRRSLKCENYVRRVIGLVSYAFYFTKEVLLSNIRIALVALSPNARQAKGRFVAYNIQDLTTMEILILSHCLNLTPGTIVAKRSYASCEIVMHTFPGGDAKLVRASVSQMKQRILRFTR